MAAGATVCVGGGRRRLPPTPPGLSGLSPRSSGGRRGGGGGGASGLAPGDPGLGVAAAAAGVVRGGRGGFRRGAGFLHSRVSVQPRCRLAHGLLAGLGRGRWARPPSGWFRRGASGCGFQSPGADPSFFLRVVQLLFPFLFLLFQSKSEEEKREKRRGEELLRCLMTLFMLLLQGGNRQEQAEIATQLGRKRQRGSQTTPKKGSKSAKRDENRA